MSTYVRCRACASEDTLVRYHVNGYALWECRDCRSITTEHILDDEGAKAYYGHGYFHGKDYQDYEASESIAKRNFDRFAVRLRAIQRQGRLLEVGCAYGYFLDIARRFWDVAGVDISAVAVENCALRYGQAVHCGSLLNLDIQSRDYDLIVAWDVIEHLDDPRACVARIYQLLKPGGHLVLTTGNVRSLLARFQKHNWRLLTPPSHLTFFSDHGMRVMLDAAGFRHVSIGTVGYDRSLAFALFRLLGSGTYGRLVSRFHGVERFLQSMWFYVNLHDIMFITGEKPPDALDEN